MAKDSYKDRRVEELAAEIFTQFMANGANRGKTVEALAADSISFARTFFRTLDTSSPEQSGAYPKE